MIGGFYMTSTGYSIRVSEAEGRTLQLLQDLRSRPITGSRVDAFMRKAEALENDCERVGQWKSERRLASDCHSG